MAPIGNVGIGTTNPGELLEIFTTANPDPFNEAFAIRLHHDGGNTGANTGDTELRHYKGADHDSTELRFALADSQGVLSEMVTFDGLTDNVGIGDTTPTEGKLVVAGTVYATKFTDSGGGYDFTIDHPTYPESKILRHWAIETDGLKTIYSGENKTNSEGIAEIQMPEWFKDLVDVNTLTYHLTSINSFGQLMIKEKSDERGKFVVQSENPNQEFNWMMIAYRNDPIAQKTVEEYSIVEDKENTIWNNTYINPQIYEKNATKSDGQ